MIIINASLSIAFSLERCGIVRTGRIISTEYNGKNKIICEFESESESKRIFSEIIESYKNGDKVYNVREKVEGMKNERQH